MKIKKFFACLIIMLMVCANIFLSACSLVVTDNKRYLAQTVAKVGSDITITLEELITGYNNFGYSYTEANGGTLSVEEAVEKTLEDLISRELLYKKSKSIYGNLTITEQNEVLTEVYDYINEQLKKLEETIVEEEDLTEVEIQEDETEEKNTITKYTKKYIRVFDDLTNTYVYKRIVAGKTEDTTLIEFVQKIYGNEYTANKAMTRYIKNLRGNDEDLKYKSKAEVFQSEVDRIYEVYEMNKYLTKFQTDFENNTPIDIEAIREKYIELSRNSWFTYYIDEAGYNEKMQNSAGEVYYQPFGDKFIQVAHILIQYSDEQTALLKEYKEDCDPDEYAELVEIEAGKITADDGKTVAEIYSLLADELSSANESEKMDILFKYIEKYNEDPGMFDAINNQTQYYTINLDTSVKDTMVKEFADASRALYEENYDKYTLYAEPVLTEYGYHIIFNMGVVENPLSGSNIESMTVYNLYDMPYMEGTDKSMFDKMAELVDQSKYAEYQSALLLELKSDVKITYYPKTYEKLYK